jgi:hypothetical protein
MKYTGIQWIYKPIGNCPVEAEGYFLNYYFYFKSRYNESTIQFAESKLAWYYDNIEKSICIKLYQNPFSAGWISEKKSILLIYKGCFLFSIYLLKNKIKSICKLLKLIP